MERRKKSAILASRLSWISRLVGALCYANNHRNDAFGSMPVPQLRRTGRFPLTVHNALERGKDPALVGTDHDVGALIDRYRTFGVMTQGETRDARDRCLFLQAARIGQDDTGVGHQIQEFEITQRVN